MKKAKQTTDPAHEENRDAIFEPMTFKGSGLKVGNRLFRSNLSGMFDDY